MSTTFLIHQLSVSTTRTSRTLKMNEKQLDSMPVYYYPPMDPLIGRVYLQCLPDRTFPNDLMETEFSLTKLKRLNAIKLFDRTYKALPEEQRKNYLLVIPTPGSTLCIYKRPGYDGPGAALIPDPKGKLWYVIEPWSHWISERLPKEPE